MYGIIARRYLVRQIPRNTNSRAIVQQFRFQSNKKLYDDAELQKIIETTNFGSEAKKKKEKEEREQRELEERVRQEEQRRQEKLQNENKVEPQTMYTNTTGGETKTVEQEGSQYEPKVESDSSSEPYTASSTSTETAAPKSSPPFTSTKSKPKVASEFQRKLQSRIDELPSNLEKGRSHLSKRYEAYINSIQDTLFTASTTINNVTGYTGIEKLKNTVDGLEGELKSAKETVKSAKTLYTEAISQRSKSQREINELLTRKHNWSPNDLERFTSLYRNDHANEQQEVQTQNELNEAESAVDAIQLKLTQSILTRYHEEQIWSDKIRKVSTWGTWLLMGINVCLFFIATFLVEPWKRKRLVGSFEDKVKQVLFEVSEGRVMEREVLEKLISSETPVAADPKETPATPESPKSPVLDVATPLSFNVFGKSWEGAKSTFWRSYNTLASTEVAAIQVNKSEFAIVTSVVAFTGAALGSLLTLYFK